MTVTRAREGVRSKWNFYGLDQSRYNCLSLPLGEKWSRYLIGCTGRTRRDAAVRSSTLSVYGTFLPDFLAPVSVSFAENDVMEATNMAGA